MNKIIRTAYGSQAEYSDLTVKALQEWNAWNDEIATGHDLPPGMTKADRVFINNSHLTLSDEAELPEFERHSVVNTARDGQEPTQLVTNDPNDEALAVAKGRKYCMDPFRRAQRGLNNVGLLDTIGGTAIADKACRFALYKSQRLGVKSILGAEAGCLETFAYDGGHVAGIKTRDGNLHTAKLIILACGGWTPSLLPQLDGLCETTAGSVALLKIPQSSPLYSRFAPENFPSWTFNMRHGAEGGLYGFARDDDGWLKFGYRGTKYINPTVQADGKERSTPITRWSEEKITTIPQQALRVIRRFIAENLPELADEGIDISMTRMCWYTDTFDNHFLIDYVPGTTQSLMIATGGSGHAFKYLPNIGQWVVDIMEGTATDKPAAKMWQWRTLNSIDKPVNILMEGKSGTRALKNVALADEMLSGRISSPKL
ncbi:FAD dependent oxidoreductase [Diaporthe amygdali]|uniref:FAD dependent oxidoreductase n=1 Tax=Phomopsis amygdali TaxID=1214568 RepID=UPI0022FDE53F|nr:FAD dependent oxidoreductase [Diaporthe amygdali]KAJ0104039.1 FAD dependent oxidoreductase [Diaporthe amygdali]